MSGFAYQFYKFIADAGIRDIYMALQHYEAKLAEYLTHEIHLEDDTADHCLKVLHAIKEEKGWNKN